MFDEKQNSCVKRIHLVTDDGLYARKTFYKVKIVFIHPLYSMLYVYLLHNSITPVEKVSA